MVLNGLCISPLELLFEMIRRSKEVIQNKCVAAGGSAVMIVRTVKLVSTYAWVYAVTRKYE